MDAKTAKNTAMRSLKILAATAAVPFDAALLTAFLTAVAPLWVVLDVMAHGRVITPQEVLARFPWCLRKI